MPSTPASPSTVSADGQGVLAFEDAGVSPAQRSLRPRQPAPAAPAGSVNKPVEAVLIRPVEGRLTLLKRRFFNILLFHAQNDPSAPAQGRYFEISLARLTADAAYESRNMEHLVDVLNQLMSTVVNWGDTPKNLKGPKYRWEGAPLLAYARIEKDERGPARLVYDFHREMHAQLLNPAVYVRLSLAMNATCKTHAALALYEAARRYKTNKDGLSKRMPWQDWVPILTGNPTIDPKLAQYKYFARDVLRPAIEEINSVQSELFVELLEGKVGRRVETLQFRTTVPPAPARPEHLHANAELSLENLALVGQLIKLRVPQESAQRFCSRYGPDKVKAALQTIEQRAANLPAIANASAYVQKLLDDPGLVMRIEPVEEIVSVRETTATAEPVSMALRRQYIQERQREAYALFLESAATEQGLLLDQFEREELPSLSAVIKREWDAFRRTGRGKPLAPFLQVPFKGWLVRQEPQPDDEAVLTWAAHRNIIRLA